MENNGYQQLAKEFMDLWQKQVSSVISDKQFLQSMLELFQTMQTAGQTTDYARKTTEHSASNATHAPDVDHQLLDELTFRLTMCEQRIATLEQHGKKSTKKSKTGAKKPKSAKSSTTKRTGASSSTRGKRKSK